MTAPDSPSGAVLVFRVDARLVDNMSTRHVKDLHGHTREFAYNNDTESIDPVCGSDRESIENAISGEPVEHLRPNTMNYPGRNRI